MLSYLLIHKHFQKLAEILPNVVKRENNHLPKYYTYTKGTSSVLFGKAGQIYHVLSGGFTDSESGTF